VAELLGVALAYAGGVMPPPKLLFVQQRRVRAALLGI